MKESGEWKSSDEIDWKRTAEALAPHVLRFREERGALNAKNYHKENSDCAVDTGEHGQHSTVVAAKTDSERV
ncbi:hypothetical protein [Kosmotoga pacifica]|nr:hypothetical protein [Kosmotoga pacifica]